MEESAGGWAPCCSRSRESDRRSVETKINNLDDSQKNILAISLKSWRARFISGTCVNS